MLMPLILGLSFFISSSLALENGLARTPPMGWLAWERFRCNTDCIDDPDNCISERLFKSMADLMVTEGYLAAGYDYLMLDDCWSKISRSQDGRLSGDPDRFPSGIAALATYVHKIGLKFGIYADYGTKTCAGYPGSIDHMEIDADTFAGWGVDYVKVDGCNSDPITMDKGFSDFGAALQATGRKMVYQCEWPLYQGSHGIKPNYTAIRENCNLWRNFYDVQDNWNNVQGIIDFYGDNVNDFMSYSGPGGWNDPDMIVGGNFGLSFEQAQTQFVLWSMFAAPLLMSVDLRTIRPEFKDLLQNKEVIKINQDPLGLAGRRVRRESHVDFFLRQVLPSIQSEKSFVVAVFNRWQDGGTPLKVTFSLRTLGVENNNVYTVRDCLSHKDLGMAKSSDPLSLSVNPTGVRLLKFSIRSLGPACDGNFCNESQPLEKISVMKPGETGWKGGARDL